MYRKFKHLNIPDGWEQYWSKYPNGYTIMEALIDWVSQVDDMVTNQNELTDTVKSFGERIDEFINQFGAELQKEVQELLTEWQTSGFIDVVISEALQWQLDDYIATNEQDKGLLTAQLQQTTKKTYISILEFEHLKDGEDWKPAIAEAINQATTQKRILEFPTHDFKTSQLTVNNVDGLTINWNHATLKPLEDLESHFIMIENSKNVIFNNYRVNGEYRYFRGLVVGENNENIVINNAIIENISPIESGISPTNINSVGILIANHNNKHIYINNTRIHGVKNNDNAIVGDSIGSSRGILIDSFGTTTIPCEFIRINGVAIENVLSEDADGIQIIGSGLEQDIKITDIYTNNTEKRSIKLQAVSGVVIDGLKARHSNRNFIMSMAISLLNANGNTLKNIDIDIKGIKGIEIYPSTDKRKTLIETVKIKMTNDEQLNATYVYPIDILDLDTGRTANNITLRDIDLTGYNNGIKVRSYTRNLRIESLTYSGGTASRSAVDLVFKPLSTPADDGLFISHKDLFIQNIMASSWAVYMSVDTTLENEYLGNAIAKNGNDPYGQLVFFKGLRYESRVFKSNSIPTTGIYNRGDYVTNTQWTRAWDSVEQAFFVTKGWLRLTTGGDHVLNTDWVVDRIKVS